MTPAISADRGLIQGEVSRVWKTKYFFGRELTEQKETRLMKWTIFVKIIFSNVFAAPKHGRGPEPQLLPDLQQAVHERRDADGAHEVCPQGPQRVRRAR